MDFLFTKLSSPRESLTGYRMTTLASDGSPDQVKRPRLLRLAVVSLVVLVVVEFACLVPVSGSGWPERVLGPAVASHLRTAALATGDLAILSIITPAVLADRHTVARCALIIGSILIGATMYLGNMYWLSASLDNAVSATLVLLAVIWVSAACCCSVWAFALASGWRLTYHARTVARRTVSIRGLIVVTALAALLFTTPRLVPRIVTQFVGSSGTVPARSSVAVEPMSVIHSAIYGFLVTISLVSGALCRRRRLAWLGLAVGSLLMTSLSVINLTRFGMSPGLGWWVATYAGYAVGALVTTLQTTIWERAGWTLVRVRRNTVSATV